MTSLEIARMIDHSILHPTFSDIDLRRECELAMQYNVATVCVKPYAVKLASKLVENSSVQVCAVIGFPHGNSAISTKLFETKQVLDDGATEIDAVVNIGKVLEEDWNYVMDELQQLNHIIKSYKAIFKLIIETDYVTNDIHKIKLCEYCNLLNIDFIKTSTGYGFIKDTDGKYIYHGATEHDIALLRKHCEPKVQVKASGGVRSLEKLLKLNHLGATRFGTTNTRQIIEDAIKYFGK